MNEEFNLSDKKIEMFNHFEYSEEDVKEFIRRLKEELTFVCPFAKDFNNKCNCKEVNKVIDKLAGEKLK